ncbi:hypothetical protein B0H14DRAFT_2630636 [Mycena olivaceomarginata]|nr:hypothetical protein B0H14DRAFT_2630636 [Mycena olivaceomarginata]
MAITRNTSARASSPTPSENSDMYYEDFHHTSSSPAPSQTADAFGWESDSTPAPMESCDVTPTPLSARPSSPASVVEISGPLAAVPTTATKPRAKATKASKGKAKAKTETPTTPSSQRTSPPPLRPPLASRRQLIMRRREHRRRVARRADPGSPAKRRRSNTAGDTSAAVPAVAAAPANTAQAPEPTASPVAMISAAHADAPILPPSPHPLLLPLPHPLLPPATASVAAPIATPVATAAATYAAALVAAPAAAPAAAPVAAPVAAPAAAPAAALAAVPAAAPVAAPFNAPAAAPVVAQAAALALPPLWLTADNLPLRGSYTPTPAGGFPAIMYSPEQLLQGVPADLIRMYEDVGFPKFFLVVSGGNGAVMRTHGLIREAIANYINIDPTTFTLGTPPTAANGSSPTLWLAADIPDPLAQGIVDARILSSTNITLYALPYNMPIIGFVGIFAGFTLPNTIMGANAARDLIGTAVQGNSEIAQFVQTHRDAFGPQVSSGEAWGTFLASITVHGIVLIVNDTNTVAWRLHVTPPTNSRESWSQLRRLFGKLRIMTALHGTAQLQRAFKCRICPAIDHPTPLCPLPDLPGWLGPTPATIAALEDASRAAASKAQEQMRLNTADGAGSSNTRSGAGRGQNSFDGKARRGGKAKRGGDFKGKGKRRERDEFL